MVTHSKQYHSITEESFQGIYKDYYVALLKYAFVIIGNKEQAKDIVADLFCQLWNNRNNTVFHTNIESYLFVCLRRLANKYLQKTTNAVFAFYDDDLVHDNNDPQSLFIQKQDTRLLDELLSKLPPLRAQIIQLRLAGMTYNQVAAQLSISPKKVEYHLTAAVDVLRKEAGLYEHFKPQLAIVIGLALLN